MRVVMPVAGGSPVARATFWWLAPKGELVDVSADDHAYWRLVRDLWQAGETFALVEHDVVIRAHALTHLECCRRPWCAYGYAARISDLPASSTSLIPATPAGHVNGYWGCVRFRASLMAAVPDLFDTPLNEPAGEGRTWQRVAATFGSILARDHGYSAHRHEPGLRHDRRA